MGLLSALTGTTFDPLVDKATSEENTSEDWALIMDICDRVTVETNGPKECFRSIVRRLNSPIPVVVMQSLTLTDALVNNCGKKFQLEVCSRDFETELRRLVSSKIHPKVSERARMLIKKWAKDFKNDPQLSLMPSLYAKLKSEGVSFKSSEPKRTRTSEAVLKNPDAVSSAQEEADIAKAIELSLRESKGGGGGASNYPALNTTPNKQPATSNNQNGATSQMYPSFNLSESNNLKSNNLSTQQTPTKEPVKVRALYDFEAAEDNELTFKSGELILVLDNSDANWWKGSNHRGEGLFPANFVTTDLSAEPEPVYKPEKKVQFNEEIKVKVLEENDHSETNGTSVPVVTEIDESRIDRLLHLLHEADPQSEKCDTEELLALEEQCVAMMPLIDQQIELIDKRHASLTALNSQLNSALNLYHDLMKESLMMDQAAAAAAAAYAQSMQAPQVAGYAPYHPGMAQQVAQPAPYDPNGHQQMGPNQAPQSNVTYGVPQYAYGPPQVSYQPQPQPPSQQQLSYDGNTQQAPPGQVPQNPQVTAATAQQPPPQQSVPAGSQQQQAPPGPYQPMYQSPTHPQSTAAGIQQQYQQSPVTIASTGQYSSPNAYHHHHHQHNTPEHPHQSGMVMQQQQQHSQQSNSPAYHQVANSYIYPGTPNSGGIPVSGVPVNAVPNLL